MSILSIEICRFFQLNIASGDETFNTDVFRCGAVSVQLFGKKSDHWSINTSGGFCNVFEFLTETKQFPFLS